MKAPSYFERVAGVRSTLPYLTPPRAIWGPSRASVVLEEAPTPVVATRTTRVVPAKPAIEAPALPEPLAEPDVVSTSRAAVPAAPAGRPRPAEGERDARPTSEPEAAAPQILESAEEPPAIETHAPVEDTATRPAARTTAPPLETIEPPARSPKPRGVSRKTTRQQQATSFEAPRATFEKPPQEHIEPDELPPPTPRRRWIARPGESPASRFVESPRERKGSSELHIGSIEVKVVPPPPPAEPAQTIVVTAPQPEGPLSRDFASSIGLRQG